MAKTIQLKIWLELKPYKSYTKTDNYYLKVSNDVKKAIKQNKHSRVLLHYLIEEDLNLMACILTSYFEDLISGTNIWNTFIKVHKRLYSKQLPFYELDGYFEGEINEQDIRFLIWYFVNTIQDHDFFSPTKGDFLDVAKSVMKVFEKEWEFAPENKHLKSFYELDEQEQGYYKVREFILRILFRTYLFFTDTYTALIIEQDEIMSDKRNERNLKHHLMEGAEKIFHSNYTKLLSMKGKEWAAEILDDGHALKKDILGMSDKITSLFFYKGQDEHSIMLEHIATGRKFELTKKSFDHSDMFTTLDNIVYIGMIKWKEEWWFTGVFFQQPYNENMVRDCREDMQMHKHVSFLDHQTEETKDHLTKQRMAFEAYNHGSLIAFLPKEKIEDFTKKFYNFYNRTVVKSEITSKEAHEKAEENGAEQNGVVFDDLSDLPDTCLIFFNPKSGIEIGYGVNSAFPMPSNPYYKEEESEENVWTLLTDDGLSTELAYYCIDNCRHELSFFQGKIGKACLNDIDFMLRYFKHNTYHTKPAVVYKSHVE